MIGLILGLSTLSLNFSTVFAAQKEDHFFNPAVPSVPTLPSISDGIINPAQPKKVGTLFFYSDFPQDDENFSITGLSNNDGQMLTRFYAGSINESIKIDSLVFDVVPSFNSPSDGVTDYKLWVVDGQGRHQLSSAIGSFPVPEFRNLNYIIPFNDTVAFELRATVFGADITTDSIITTLYKNGVRAFGTASNAVIPPKGLPLFYKLVY